MNHVRNSELADHMKNCHGATGALVVHKGSAAEQVRDLLAEGWTWSYGTEDASTELVAGKRIRYLDPPRREETPTGGKVLEQ